MSGDVTIPAETARAMAAWLRLDGGDLPSATVDAWADALDPRPSLRDAVARAVSGTAGLAHARTVQPGYYRIADAALAVVRDHIAALPAKFGHDAISRVDILADLGAES